MSNLIVWDEPPLVLQPSLAVKLGSADAAIVLQQFHYMLKQTKFIVDGVPWVRGSYEELLGVFPWLSISSLKRIILGLQQRKMLIAEQRGSQQGDCRKWYTLNLSALQQDTPSDEIVRGSAQNEPTLSSEWPDPQLNLRRPSAQNGPSNNVVKTYIKTYSETYLKKEERAPVGAPARGEQYLPLAAECRQVIEAGASQLDVGGRLPEFEPQAAAQVIEQLIRLDSVPEEEILQALRWAYSGEPSFPWHLQLLSIAQWRKRGKGNNIPKFVSLWRQWRASLQRQGETRTNGHLATYDIGRIME